MNNESNKIQPIDISVTSGTSVVITIPELFLKNGCFFNLLFCLKKPDLVAFKDLITGTEVVTIQNGINGNAYVLEDNTANIFYADLLRLRILLQIKIR